jgi:hypothetical protein
MPRPPLLCIAFSRICTWRAPLAAATPICGWLAMMFWKMSTSCTAGPTNTPLAPFGIAEMPSPATPMRLCTRNMAPLQLHTPLARLPLITLPLIVPCESSKRRPRRFGQVTVPDGSTPM